MSNSGGGRNVDREDIKRNIKKNLRELVSVKGITQAKLGEILDVSGKATVSNYLNDSIKSIPDITSLYKLKNIMAFPLMFSFRQTSTPLTAMRLKVHI